jgi:glucokinase
MTTAANPVYLGTEIGGTKLQIGLGPDDGVLRALWRGTVEVARGPDGIREQIRTAVPRLLSQAGLARESLRGVGIGFGGPVDDDTRTVIKSHQIPGWDDFPLADWLSELVGVPAVLGNDADVAGLAEARHGAGKGFSPIFYITVGSGIGGGFVIDGTVYRGIGRGAAEIGHLRMRDNETSLPLEQVASGWAIGQRAAFVFNDPNITAAEVGRRAAVGDAAAQRVLDDAITHLAEAICHVIALLCPRRIVVGGGVSLLGEQGFFAPLRRKVADRVFRPFAGLTEVVPAVLGEEVVVHGAIALARARLSGRESSPPLPPG